MQQGQASAHATVHDIAYSDARYLGLLAWSGFDSPSGNGNEYNGVKYTGVVDLFRNPSLGMATAAIHVLPAAAATAPPEDYATSFAQVPPTPPSALTGP